MAPKGVSNRPPPPPPPSSSSSSSPSSSRDKVYRFISDPEHKETLSGRVRAACLTCRRKKIKCSGTEPCQTCRDRGLKCEGLPPRKRAQRVVDPYQPGTSPDGDLDESESIVDSPGSYSIDSSISRQNSVGIVSSQSNPFISSQPSSKSPVLGTANTRGLPKSSPTELLNVGANVNVGAPSGYEVYQASSPRQHQSWSASPVAGPSAWTSEVYSRSRGINTSSTTRDLSYRSSSQSSMSTHQNNPVTIIQNTQPYPSSSAVLTSDAPATVDSLTLLFPDCVDPSFSASTLSNFGDDSIQQQVLSSAIERGSQAMLPFERTEAQLTPNWNVWDESIQQRELQRQAAYREMETEIDDLTAQSSVGRRAKPKSGYLFSKASQRPWPYDQ